MFTGNGRNSAETKESLAVFIDVHNTFEYVNYPRLIRELAIRGQVIETCAVGDFRYPDLKDPQMALVTCGVRMVQVPRIPNGASKKSIDDQWLAKEVYECLEKSPHISTYVLVTGDGDFIPLVASLHARGKRVVIVSGTQGLSSFLEKSLLDDDELILVGQPDRMATRGVSLNGCERVSGSHLRQYSTSR